MTKILCGLPICTNIADTRLFHAGQLENEKYRLKQYIEGIKKFVELNKSFIEEKKIDVYITDNTVNESTKLPLELLNIIPDNIKIITCLNNNYGCYNKGAGVIEQWIYCKELIKQYDYFIHFEPRQLLIDNSFIDDFINNPRSLFTYNNNEHAPRHFNTGLFACKTSELIHFIEENKPIYLVNYVLSIEYVLYNFFKKHNYIYDILTKMSLIWYDGNGTKQFW